VEDDDRIEISTLARRPDPGRRLWDVPDAWPEFMTKDPVAAALYDRVPEEFPQYCVVAADGDRVVARGPAVPFDRDGEVEVPGALAPVRCDTARGHAVYVEANVWVRHRLVAQPAG
jgi:hypothetical protein